MKGIPLASALSVLLIVNGYVAAKQPQTSNAVRALWQAHPGVKLRQDGPDVLSVYGGPMTAGATPDQAAQRWLTDHSDVFDIDNLDLRLLRSMDLSRGKATLFWYEQFVDGVLVENARARITVLNGDPHRVIYVSARLGRPPATGFRADAIDARTALQSVRQLPAYADLSQWTQPDLVVFWRDDTRKLDNPVRVWRFQGSRKDQTRVAGYTLLCRCRGR